MKVSICLFLATVAKLASAQREDIHVLMYETDSSLENDSTSPLSFFKERSTYAHLPTTVYGGGLEYHGFGDKYQTLRSLLEVIDPTKLVVVADARDVALNVPADEKLANQALDRFIDNYKKLTVNDPHAVVMSAESQCCVSAMTHAHPSEYFDPVTRKRNKRACSSGTPGCYWNENENIHAWVDFHRQRAYNKTGIERVGNHVGDVYLNAGLMAGYPSDLINLLDMLDIDPAEDDQAVLSGLMYQFPEMLLLDYDQELFGNNQWPRGLEHGCVFEKGKQDMLVHPQTKSQPLIIHTPGKFYGCLDVLIEELGGTSQQRYLSESPEGNPRRLQREGKSAVVQEQRKLDETNEECKCICSRRRNLGFMDKVEKFLARMSSRISSRTQTPEKEDVSPRFIAPMIDIAPPMIKDIETEESEEAGANDVQYGNYGNYGNYGQYGNYGVSNYGSSITTKADTAPENYGNYGYGVTRDAAIEETPVDCLQVCFDECYGDYEASGNYGQYGQYGQYGSLRRRTV